jgi:hypothetical protein
VRGLLDVYARERRGAADVAREVFLEPAASGAEC